MMVLPDFDDWDGRKWFDTHTTLVYEDESSSRLALG